MTYPDFGTKRDNYWSASLKEAGLLLLLAVVLTAGSWLLRSDPLPWKADPTVYELELAVPLLEIPAAREFFAEGVHIFIDTRAGRPDERATIAGAFVIREATFNDDLLAYFDDLFPEDPLVLFGDGDLVGTNNVAGRLLERGFSDVQILRGGVKGWDSAGGDLGQPYLPEALTNQPAGEGQ